jgi:alkylated DNA repair dioxygenase AlkB
MTTQMHLFDNPLIASNAIDAINGLSYLKNYISFEDEKKLIAEIDNQIWLTDLKRRVQHYGYKYDYKARRINIAMKIGALPNWLQDLAIRLHNDGYFSKTPDQVIINEYTIGQGITHHIDCEPCFEDTVVSISLNSTCVMDFKNPKTDEKIPLLLQPRSAVVLKGESRYDWEHGIAARKSDKYNEVVYPRKRRVSLTFRKVIL